MPVCHHWACAEMYWLSRAKLGAVGAYASLWCSQRQNFGYGLGVQTVCNSYKDCDDTEVLENQSLAVEECQLKILNMKNENLLLIRIIHYFFLKGKYNKQSHTIGSEES